MGAGQHQPRAAVLSEGSQLGALHLLPKGQNNDERRLWRVLTNKRLSLPERGVGHVRAECEGHLSPAPGLDHSLVRAAHAAQAVVKVVSRQSSPLTLMSSVVQDVGSERGVGGGGGVHGHHGWSGGGRDPQLLEVDGGEALALSLHLLQHPDQSEESMRTIDQ